MLGVQQQPQQPQPSQQHTGTSGVNRLLGGQVFQNMPPRAQQVQQVQQAQRYQPEPCTNKIPFIIGAILPWSVLAASVAYFIGAVAAMYSSPCVDKANDALAQKCAFGSSKAVGAAAGALVLVTLMGLYFANRAANRYPNKRGFFAGVGHSCEVISDCFRACNY